MRLFKNIIILTILSIAFTLLAPSALLANECQDSSGDTLSSQPVDGMSICATITGGKGDVAPHGNPDGKLDISDAVVTVRMFMHLLDNVDATYMSKADVAPLCTQAKKDLSECANSGDSSVNISDAVVIVRLAMGDG